MRVLVAILIVLAALAFVAFPAEAGDGGVIRAGSYSAGVGEEVTVVLVAVGIPEPGLGAWTIDMTYDTAVVTATGCEAQLGGVCSPAFMDDTVRTTGALAAGVLGSFSLTTFSFRCEVAGTSELILTEEVLTTAEPVQEGTILLDNGSITCTEPGQDGVIRIASNSGVVGDEVSVVLEAVDIPPPGLGAWDVDVTYDTAIVSLAGCAPRQGGICDLERREDTVRVAGANAAGLPGTFALAEIVFACKAVGTTDLEVRLSIFGVFPIGSPEPPGAVSGSLTCIQAQEQPTGLPSTGVAEWQPSSLPAAVPIAVLGAVLVAAASAFRRDASLR
ncbi:MAG: hypothetical protein IIC91_09860 [Chloroflexi bacterium]|nr:hypothetical protein [Chloroflexota bacterium]